ncbi:helix-turn-helix domain-containing protein [Gordonia caeni]|uniref:AraC family transcriptional regulator n=1 Tax=Gordonia caeni TaxID=1007097 RepID=A0ABP7PLJ0_9ACTN
MALDDGAVVVPIGGIDPDGVTTPRVIDVPEAWNGWLLYAYGESLGYLDRTPAASVIEARLRESGRGPAAMPPMPVCPAAVEVARRVLTDVAGFSSLPEEAARAGWSVRTLQRRFRAETGLSVTEWVRRARLGVAADLLAAGRDPEWVAHRVGYQTASGFSRVFSARTGVTPGRWRPEGSDGGGHGHGDEPAPPLPAQRTWTRVNGAAVAVWVARGQATVTVGERCHHLRAGHALVLPAGVPNRIRTGAESLVIPVGFRPGGGGVGATVRPADFGPEEQWRLLEASVACYTGLPVRGAADGVDLVLSGAQWEPASADDRLLADLANALAWGDDPQDRALGQWAAAFGVSESRIRRAVREATGMGFAHWQRLARMSSARSRLLHGGSVGKVARDLGYAHVSGFSRAFCAVHGAPPGRCTARKAG